MKIHQINIINHHHLKDLKLDFTYQDGPKKGQPLEKICLIGQSGTGKTTVLNLIKEFIRKFTWIKHYKVIEPKFKNNLFNQLNNVQVTCSTSNINIKETNLGWDILYENNQEFQLHDTLNFSNLKFNDLFKDTLCLYITSEITQNENSILVKKNNTTDEVSESTTSYGLNQKLPSFPTIGVTISPKTKETTWLALLANLFEYDNNLKRKGADLIQKGIFTNINRMQKEIEAWKKENPNPRVELAEKVLNPILDKINLELDTDTSEALITLRNKSDNSVVPGDALSTGTKQLILSLIPLYQLKINGALVMIDEPERSLFPDIQQELIGHYRRICPDSQLIVATHSPFIAASFEPEERFIFKFNANGKVVVSNGVAPIGDDPNDILKQDFDLPNLMNEEGIKMYRKYLAIRAKAKKEQDKTKKEQLIKEAAAIGDKYNF